MPETRRPWRKWAAYGAFALVSFVVSLRCTFPAEAVAARLAAEAAAAGWQLRTADVGPAGLVGVRMTGVTLESADGARVPIEQVTAKLRLLPLVLGRRGVDFDARLFDGRVSGTAETRSASRRLAMRIDRVDLARAAAMRKIAHVDLGGVVTGAFDVALDLKDVAKSTGRLELAVAQAAVLGGEVPIAAMGGAPLTLPRLGLGAVTARAAVRDGKATFDTLTAKGDDVEVEGEGLYAVVQARVAQAPIFGKARVRFADALWAKPGAAALRGVVELALAPARSPRDGSYTFQVFGTLSDPNARPAPGS